MQPTTTATKDTMQAQPVPSHLQHARPAQLLVGRGRAQVEGARHIGGAAVELPAAVDQQQRAAVHGGRTGLVGAVVDDGAVRPRA